MGRLHDSAYAIALTVASPVLGLSMLRSGKWRTDWAGRTGRGATLPRSARTRVLVHGVSVGEVMALKPLVRELSSTALGDVDVVISATTNTGFAQATRLFGTDHQVVRYPFDFTRMVERFLDRIQPDIVVLAELELWPNFTEACQLRGIPLAVVNGRLSERSFGRYRRARRLVRSTFGRLDLVVSQSEPYRERFVYLGADPARCHVTGSLKWDAAPGQAPGDAAGLAHALGIDPTKPLVVAGSTGPGEEAALIAARPEGVQLLIAPRKPERFDEVAALATMRRRSRSEAELAPETPPELFLLDTIGELATAYALADAVFVGRSLVPMGGSNPIESVALGKPTVIGPHHENFAVIVDDLSERGGIVVSDRPFDVIQAWLNDPDRSAAVAAAGLQTVEKHRGAARRTANLVLDLIR